MPLALLVDRDAVTRQLFSAVLQQSAYDVEQAEDGREGLAKAISYRPNVIVTETQLPGMSGVDLCRLLRLDQLTQQVPIIVVTADESPRTTALAQGAGADAVLIKPCPPQRLFTEIERLSGEGKAPREHSRAFLKSVPPDSERSNESISGMDATNRRVILSHAHHRHATTQPPIAPSPVLCPACDRPLRYVYSQVGGVSQRQPEQWDYFECTACGGVFEFRQRTRKLRVSPVDVRGIRAGGDR